MKKGRLYIGTSGWQYKHWKGTFYPDDLPVKDHFHYYCSVFDTVEINNSFYMLPAVETFMEWRKDSPRHFLFSVKGNRYITHMKKLKVDKQSIGKFFRHAAKLEGKLGPVLFQLPQNGNLMRSVLKGFFGNCHVNSAIPLNSATIAGIQRRSTACFTVLNVRFVYMSSNGTFLHWKSPLILYMYVCTVRVTNTGEAIRKAS